MRRSGRTERARWSNQRPALRLAAMFALLLHVFLVQTHIHAAAAPLSVGYERGAIAGGEHADTVVTSPDNHQSVCAICDVMASAGAATLAVLATDASEESARAEAAAIALSLAPYAHTHSWRSRAPPAALTA